MCVRLNSSLRPGCKTRVDGTWTFQGNRCGSLSISTWTKHRSSKGWGGCLCARVWVSLMKCNESFIWVLWVCHLKKLQIGYELSNQQAADSIHTTVDIPVSYKHHSINFSGFWTQRSRLGSIAFQFSQVSRPFQIQFMNASGTLFSKRIPRFELKLN